MKLSVIGGQLVQTSAVSPSAHVWVTPASPHTPTVPSAFVSPQGRAPAMQSPVVVSHVATPLHNNSVGVSAQSASVVQATGASQSPVVRLHVSGAVQLSVLAQTPASQVSSVQATSSLQSTAVFSQPLFTQASSVHRSPSSQSP
ncbi:MAG: hypothetical protein AAB341_05905, partial [Planctomycetota bacterium]